MAVKMLVVKKAGFEKLWNRARPTRGKRVATTKGRYGRIEPRW